MITCWRMLVQLNNPHEEGSFRPERNLDENLTQRQNGRVEPCYLGKSHESHVLMK